MCVVERSFLGGGAVSGGSVNPIVETSVKRMCAAEELSDNLTLWPKENKVSKQA